MRHIVTLFLGLALSNFALAADKAKDTKAKATETKTEAPAAAKAETQIELNLNPAPYTLNMDRIDYARKGSFGESKTFIVPTAYIRITARTQTEIASEGSSGASVKAIALFSFSMA